MNFPDTQGLKEVILSRRPLTTKIVLVLENYDSYLMTVEELRRFFRLLKSGEYFVEQTLDRLHSFYCVHVDIENEVITTLPRKEVEEKLVRIEEGLSYEQADETF